MTETSRSHGHEFPITVIVRLATLSQRGAVYLTMPAGRGRLGVPKYLLSFPEVAKLSSKRGW
jgi:hypothetical protein